MREIKFRAKRIDANKFPTEYQWVYGQYFKTPLTDENSGTKPEDGWFFLSGEPRHCIVQDGVSFVIDVNTLGQFTGLKVQGKEIYEGDILHVWGGAYALGNWEVDEKTILENYVEDTFSLSFAENIEVIGNIYDNPDLLK